MIEDYLIAGAYKVAKTNHTLYNSASAATLVLTGSAPSISFRLKVNLSGSDCNGTVTVNGETLIFSAAGTKITTTLLSSLPTIITSGLNCTILITCIDAGGADIKTETLTAIDTRIDVKQSGFYSTTGTWTKTDNVIYSNTSMNIGDTVRSNTTDYIIKKKDAYTDIGGTVELYSYLV